MGCVLYRPAVLVFRRKNGTPRACSTGLAGLVQLSEAQISHVLPLKSKGNHSEREQTLTEYQLYVRHQARCFMLIFPLGSLGSKRCHSVLQMRKLRLKGVKQLATKITAISMAVGSESRSTWLKSSPFLLHHTSSHGAVQNLLRAHLDSNHMKKLGQQTVPNLRL